MLTRGKDFYDNILVVKRPIRQIFWSRKKSYSAKILKSRAKSVKEGPFSVTRRAGTGLSKKGEKKLQREGKGDIRGSQPTNASSAMR